MTKIKYYWTPNPTLWDTIITLLSSFRLAIFESKRENDCVSKYLIKEFEDATAKQYAIGIRDESDYPYIYEWHRVSDATKASLTFQNWDNSKDQNQIHCIDKCKFYFSQSNWQQLCGDDCWSK